MSGGARLKKTIILTFFLFPFLFVKQSYGAELKLDITEALKLFRENSRIVKIYKNEEEAKKYLIEKAKATKLPTVDIDLNYNFLNEEPRSKTPFGNLPLGEKSYLKGQLIISQLIYDFGVRDTLIDRTVLDKELTKLYLNKELNDGSLQVTYLFNQLLLTKKVYEVYLEEHKLLTEQKKRIEGFYNEGLVTKNELLQIQVELSNTSQKIISLTNDIENLKERLKTLLNITGEIEVVDKDFDSSIVNVEKAIYEKRPEVQIANKLITLKELELKALEGDNYPKFYGAAGLNYEENRYRTADQYLFLTLGLKVNLYDGKKNFSEKLSLLKQKQELEEKVRQVKDLVRLDIIEAINDLKTASNKITVAKEAIAQAKENLAIEQGRYEEQLITATDLIAATLRLSRANLNYYEAINNYKNTCFKLLWAKGELYRIDEVKKDE